MVKKLLLWWFISHILSLYLPVLLHPSISHYKTPLQFLSLRLHAFPPPFDFFLFPFLCLLWLWISNLYLSVKELHKAVLSIHKEYHENKESLNLLVFFFKFYTGPLQYDRKPLRFLSSEHRYPKTCVTYDATYVTHVKEKKKAAAKWLQTRGWLNSRNRQQLPVNTRPKAEHSLVCVWEGVKVIKWESEDHRRNIKKAIYFECKSPSWAIKQRF